MIKKIQTLYVYPYFYKWGNDIYDKTSRIKIHVFSLILAWQWFGWILYSVSVRCEHVVRI